MKHLIAALLLAVVFGSPVDCNYCQPGLDPNARYMADPNLCWAPSMCADSPYRMMDFYSWEIKAPYTVCTNLDIARNISETWLTSDEGCDSDGDGFVNFFDFAAMIKRWEQGRRLWQCN
jgi:hypothetical protein